MEHLRMKPNEFEREIKKASVEKASNVTGRLTTIVDAVAREMWELGFIAGVEWCCRIFKLDVEKIKGDEDG